MSLILLHEPGMKKYEVVDGRTIYRIPLPIFLEGGIKTRKSTFLFITKAVELIDENQMHLSTFAF